MTTLHYFAYGSNMSSRRMQARLPAATVVATATLDGYRLAMHKVGRDGSAKCDALAVDDPKARLHGVLYRIAAAERARLDDCEGLGDGYRDATVEVRLGDGRRVAAFLYIATRTNPRLRPFDWYKTHVLHGAREHHLPDDYLVTLAALDSVPDPDPVRSAAELAIYR